LGRVGLAVPDVRFTAVSVVCGQYNARGQTGGYDGYAWFFVAIKDSQVLWADVDHAADGPGVAYLGCKGAGLAS
jgi:hypothetical protein